MKVGEGNPQAREEGKLSLLRTGCSSLAGIPRIWRLEFRSLLTETISKASTSHVILHKAGHTDEVTNYRPISLLNADWKLLSSIFDLLPQKRTPTSQETSRRHLTLSSINTSLLSSSV